MALPALRRQMICHTQRYENCVWPEPKFWIRNRHLRVASDFSGMEAPIITMRWCLKLGVHHTFSSETNLSARKLSDTLFKPDVLFGDVRSRIPDQPEMEDNDMYFASAPCQPFSSSGKGLGTEDRDGLLIFAAITYMVMNKPIMALFEQVPLTGKHKTLLEKVEQYATLAAKNTKKHMAEKQEKQMVLRSMCEGGVPRPGGGSESGGG